MNKKSPEDPEYYRAPLLHRPDTDEDGCRFAEIPVPEGWMTMAAAGKMPLP